MNVYGKKIRIAACFRTTLIIASLLLLCDIVLSGWWMQGCPLEGDKQARLLKRPLSGSLTLNFSE